MKIGVWRARAVADQDIDDISSYIARDNPEAGERFVRVVHENFDLLARFPRAGQRRRAKSRRLSKLHSWPIGGAFRRYLILYLERNYGAEILRVAHGMRDVEKLTEDID